MRRSISAPFGSVGPTACGLLLGLVLGCKDDGGDDRLCEPGTPMPCSCSDGANGLAECSPDGMFFEPCRCGGGTGGTSTGDDTGTGTAGTGETCGTDGCADGSTSGSTGGPACVGQPIYAGLIADQPAAWSFMALEGYAAGLFMCEDMGFDHPCDYDEVVAAENAGELAALAGTTAWLHRTTTVPVNMMDSDPGAGGRCADWTITDDTLADGEFIEIGAGGTVTYNFDDDTFYDGIDTTHTQPDALPCNAITRAILCCNPCQ